MGAVRGGLRVGSAAWARGSGPLEPVCPEQGWPAPGGLQTAAPCLVLRFQSSASGSALPGGAATPTLPPLLLRVRSERPLAC